jgi:hypothetical protein
MLYVEDSRLLGRIFNPPAGWFVQVGGLTEGAGLAAGGGYRFPAGDSATVDARGVMSWSRAYLADLTWRYSPVPTGRVLLSANVARERHANQLFFGLGPDTPHRAATEFALAETRVAAGVDVRLTRWLTAGAGGGYNSLSPDDLDLEIEDGEDDLEAGDVPPGVASLVSGIGRDASFGSIYGRLEFDTRGTRAGGLRIGLRQGIHRGRNADGRDFTSLRVEVQQFVPMWHETRILAFNVVAEKLSPRNGDALPSYLYPTVGGSRTLRAYDRQRFRDASTLLLQAEYRYAVNPFLTGAIFADAGQVAGAWDHFRLDAFHGDVGVGLRVGYGNLVVIRSDLAFGGDGPRLVIALSGVF